MSPSDLHSIATVAITTCFAVVGAVWVLGAIYNFVRARDEQDHVWFVWPAYVLFLVAAGVLNRTPTRIWNPLIVHATWMRLSGLGLLAVATLFTLSARLALGTMWTGDPSIKVGHQLRTHGPYALVRHPIYTGLLAMWAGAVLLGGGGRWVVFLAINLVILEVKIIFEERLLMSAFPDEYRRYRSRVPKLVPGLKLLMPHAVTPPTEPSAEQVPRAIT